MVLLFCNVWSLRTYLDKSFLAPSFRNLASLTLLTGHLISTLIYLLQWLAPSLIEKMLIIADTLICWRSPVPRSYCCRLQLHCCLRWSSGWKPWWNIWWKCLAETRLPILAGSYSALRTQPTEGSLLAWKCPFSRLILCLSPPYKLEWTFGVEILYTGLQMHS